MSFCPNLKNKQVKQEFDELVSIFGEDVAYLLWNKNNGYSLDKAPNGADSILYKSLLTETKDRRLAFVEKAKTYSKSFKLWFLDSKAIDENGEPLVLFHGTDKTFNEFLYDLDGSRGRHLVHDPRSFFFTDTREKAFRYKHSYVMPVYLSILNPGKSSVKDGKYKTINEYTNRENEIIKDDKYDSAIFVRYDKEGDNHGAVPTTLWVAKYPNLIKSAIANNGNFSISDNNIYNSLQDLSSINHGAYGRLSSILSEGNIDALIQYVDNRRDYINSLTIKLAFAACRRYFRDHKNNPKYKIVDNAEFAGRYDETANTIIINKSALFRNESKLLCPEIQTIVHEMLHAVTVNVVKNDSRVRLLFERLLEKTRESLGDLANDYGLKNVYEFISELSNKEFVDKLRSILYTPKQTLLDKFKIILKKVYMLLFNSYKKFIGSDTVYSNAIEDLLGIMSYDENKFDNVLDKSAPLQYESISSNIDDIQKQLILQHTRLYTEYKKKLNKTPEQERRQDILWNTIQKLRAQEAKESADFAALSALLITGTYIVDPVTQQPLNSPRSTILGFLQEESANDFKNLTPELVLDMQQTIISFYNDIYKSLFDNSKYLDFETLTRIRDLGTALQYINGLWVLAANTVGDRIVDLLIDRYINKSEKEKDDMKLVAKDWLHKNEMYGDTAWLENMIRYSRLNSPIIKLAFLLMQDANQKTQKEASEIQSKIMKMFLDANSLVDDLSLGNWQTDLMERYSKGKKKGLFTGNFRSALNRGLFKADLEEFMNDLIKEFDDKYGYHYVTDDITGQVSRSDTEESIENESWNGDVAPTYIEWRRKIENWLCDHAERRYTKDYYNEMLSKPYDYKAKSGHGLSPKTISRQRYIQDQINYLLQKCTDKKTNLAHPENLSKNDKAKLKMWKDALNDLSNPFTVYGELKQGEDFLIAVELLAWNKFIRDNTDYDTDTELFDKDYDKLQDEVNKGIRPYSDLLDFVEENSQFDIDPDYLEFVIGKTKSNKDLIIAMYQSSIKNLVKTRNGFRKDMYNILFSRYSSQTFGDVLKVTDAIKCYRDADVKNEELNTKSSINPEDFLKYLSVQTIPYTDATGKYISRVDGKLYNPGLIKYDDAISWYEYVLDRYTLAALDGTMPEYRSNDGSIHVEFSSFNGNRAAIRDFIDENILSYTHSYTDKYGMPRYKKMPLSIFMRLYPTLDTFADNKPTTRNVPNGRYTNKGNNSGVQLYNDNFFKEEGTQMLPKFDLYGDSDFVKQILKGDKKALYYKFLIDTMQQCWDELGLDSSYNRYKLPQLEGTSGQKLSRAYKNPILYAKNKVLNAFGITSDDTNERSDNDYIQQNGKWVLNSIATRYINDLDDPNQISSDLAYTVGLFYRMTKNYLNKKLILPLLETLGYNLLGENREQRYSTTGTRLYDIYQKMLKQLLYESNMTNLQQGSKPSKKLIAAQKAANSLRSLAAVLKLGLNIPSMLTGVWDSLTLIPSIAARGDLFTIKSLIKSMIATFPNLFKAFMNIGNPIANCKAVAMMLKDLLVRDNKHTYSKGYKNRITKAVSESIMGGYTLGDYMTNMLLLRSVYESKKYYDGYKLNGKYIVKPGFYLKNSLIRTLIDSGLTKQEALNEASHCTESLWDAYEFKNGLAVLKDKYKLLEQDLGKPLDSQESATIKQTAALVNGNNPDNDNSAVSNNLMYKFFFFLRNYITSRAEHWFAGWKPDNIVREKEDVIENQVRGSSVVAKKKAKWKNLTDEQKARRVNYDYSTGEALPALFVNLIRGARSLMRAIKNVILGMIGKQKSTMIFNPNEVRAIKEVIMYGMLLSALTIGWMMFHGWAYEETKDTKPDDLEGSIPTVDNFVKLKVYLKLIDNVMLRTIDSQALLLNPVLVVDMVRNATSVMSAIDDWSAPTAAMLDLTGISGHDLDEEITSDSRFKYYTRWQRAAITSFGPLNNLQKWTSWRGNDKVERWFFDNTITGTGLKASGVSWKNEDSNNPFLNIGLNIGYHTMMSSMDLRQKLMYLKRIQANELKKRYIELHKELIKKRKKEAEEYKKRMKELRKRREKLGY